MSSVVGATSGGVNTVNLSEYQLAVAKYYEERNMLDKAASNYANSGDFAMALQLYMKQEDIPAAIAVVGKVRCHFAWAQMGCYLLTSLKDLSY